MSWLAAASILATASAKSDWPLCLKVMGAPWTLEIPLQINGNEEWFLLDSWSQVSTVRRDAHNHGPYASVDLSSQGRYLAHVHAYVPPGASDLDQYPQVSGILGLDFLDQVVLLVDSAHREAAVWPAGRADASLAQAWFDKQPAASTEEVGASPWTQTNLLRTNGESFVAAKVGNHTLKLGLDCASMFTAISQSRLSGIRHADLVKGGKFEGAPTYTDRTMIEGLKTDFLSTGLRTVTDVEMPGAGDGLFGEDDLQTGVWILDRARDQFGFRAYPPRPFFQVQTPTAVFYWSQEEYLLSVNPSFHKTSSMFLPIVAIDGKVPDAWLAIVGPNMETRQSFEQIAANLKQIFSKPILVEVVDDEKPKTFRVTATAVTEEH